MNEPSIPRQRPNRLWRTMAFAIPICILAIMVVVLGYCVILYRQSRALVNAVQAVRIGAALDAHFLGVAKELGSIAYIKVPPSAKYFHVDPSTLSDPQYAKQFVVSPIEHCVVEDCTVSIPGPKLQVDYLDEVSERHPTTLLPAFRWIFGQSRLHRWLPVAWFDPVMITVAKGVVQELDVQMRSLSVDEQICPQAETRITAASPGTLRWAAASFSAHMTGNTDCGSVRGIRVSASIGANREQLTDALDFNVRCLLPGGYCTECDMLPDICHKYISQNPNGSASHPSGDKLFDAALNFRGISEAWGGDPRWERRRTIVVGDGWPGALQERF
jgi:hypothetical protein